MSGYLHDLASTAILRHAALEAEKRLEWEKASDLWRQAIDAYPAAGRLAELDMAKMESRRQACLTSAREMRQQTK